ncbi:MAG: methyl-accepting chemotaxis protein [Desulfobacterales bacterium]|nr:methyl-accepting chemotaxis protein [Desulfobacterales bacterium]
MKEKKQSRRSSIAMKTSVASGIIILILLAISSFIGIRLQSGLSDSMIDEFVTTQKTALEEESVQLKKSLIANMAVNLEICTSVTRSFLYNFDQEQCYKLLASYLKLEGMVAIKVLDADGNPFAAAWKQPDITTDSALPDTVKVDEKLSIVSDAVHEGEKVGSVRLYYTNDLVNQKIKATEDQTQSSIASFQGIAKKKIGQSITTQLVVALVIIVFLIVTIVACLQIFVTRPIKNTIEMIRDIAQGEGDLTKRLVVKTRDEIGELSTWFNQFIEKLQDLIKEVSENATTVDTASTHFSKLSDCMNAGVDGLAERATSVAGAADNMSDNMTSVAAAMEQASTNINMVATASEEMSSTINEIATNAEKARSITDSAVTQTQSASKQVNELGDAANQIGKVVETITDISEQVNLLALNATIEAARAGEAGKGFAVVANEIKDLANQTAEASGAIKDQIQGIQTSTNGTVEEITSISEVVTEINAIVATIATAVEEQSATTREIAENISHASTGINEVNENVSEGSSSSQQVAQEIAEVNEATNGLMSSSEEVKENADKLSVLGDGLAELMGKFKV